MTIKIIERPSHGSSWWHVASDVRTVSERAVIFHDGSQMHKNLFAKFEILSLMDAPEEWEERKAFFREVGNVEGEFANVFDGYVRMKAEEFNALDLPFNFA